MGDGLRTIFSIGAGLGWTALSIDTDVGSVVENPAGCCEVGPDDTANSSDCTKVGLDVTNRTETGNCEGRFLCVGVKVLISSSSGVGAVCWLGLFVDERVGSLVLPSVGLSVDGALDVGVGF